MMGEKCTRETNVTKGWLTTCSLGTVQYEADPRFTLLLLLLMLDLVLPLSVDVGVFITILGWGRKHFPTSFLMGVVKRRQAQSRSHPQGESDV